MVYSERMDPLLFPFIVGAVILVIVLVDRIPRDWRAAIGGLMILLLIADSVIAGLRALFQ